jgi:hypothetical protein
MNLSSFVRFFAFDLRLLFNAIVSLHKLDNVSNGSLLLGKFVIGFHALDDTSSFVVSDFVRSGSGGGGALDVEGRCFASSLTTCFFELLPHASTAATAVTFTTGELNSDDDDDAFPLPTIVSLTLSFVVDSFWYLQLLFVVSTAFFFRCLPSFVELM